MIADLHVHTTASDGVLSPAEAVQLAVRQGVELMAVTDHDTVAGADELADAEALPLRVLQGVELSLSDMKGLHLLGYGKLSADAPLRQQLTALRRARVTRMTQMVARLHALHVAVEADALSELGGAVGRPHLARLLVQQGYAADVKDAFARYLAEGRPAYVAAERLDMAQAPELMQRSGMVPILAHPARLEIAEQLLPALLDKWQGMGLMGVEVYHPAQASRGFASREGLARRRNLLVTGGSDFHAAGTDGHGMIGETAEKWPRIEEDVQALLSQMETLQRRTRRG